TPRLLCRASVRRRLQGPATSAEHRVRSGSLPPGRTVAAMPDPVMPGAEPWSAAGGPNGVLVLHGFTGNPQSMRPLAEAFAAAGFAVDLPLLPGHGTAVEDMVPTRWADWSGAADKAYSDLAARSDKVVVAGLSMGGTLTAWLAARHPEIAGIVLVNALVQPQD